MSSLCAAPGELGRAVVLASHRHAYSGTGHQQGLVCFDIREPDAPVNTRVAVVPYGPRGLRTPTRCVASACDGYKVLCASVVGGVVSCADVRTWRSLFEFTPPELSSIDQCVSLAFRGTSLALGVRHKGVLVYDVMG